MHAPKTTESEEKIITPVNLNDESSDASRVGDRGDEPPDGGLQAWLVVLSGFLVYFATFGEPGISSRQDPSRLQSLLGLSDVEKMAQKR